MGETVRIGYFRQEVPHMDGDTRVIDYVKEIGSRIETPEGMLTASQLLEQFLFPAEEQWSPICKLSGGEKRRLYLLSVLAAAPNVLPAGRAHQRPGSPDSGRPGGLPGLLPRRGGGGLPRPLFPGSGGPPGVRRGGGRHGEGLSRRATPSIWRPAGPRRPKRPPSPPPRRRRPTAPPAPRS